MKEIKDYTYSDIIKADEGKLEIINENISNIYKMKEIKDFSFLDDEPEYEVKLSFIINELKRSADKYELDNMVLPIEVIKFIADNTTDYRTIEAACDRLIAYANIDRIKNITLDMAKNKIFNNYFNKQDVKDESILEILETTSPYAFLKEKLGRTPSKDEVKILEYLLVDKQLIPSGVNLLVDYILKTHNNQLDIELTKKFANCFKNSSLAKISEYNYDWLDESMKDRTIKNIFVNNFKSEFIVYAITEPDTGHVALNCSTIRKSIQLGKKVLLYSLEQPKDIMLKRIGLAETSNLLIQDKPLENIEKISTTLDSFNPDLLIIDRLELLTHNSKTDDINIFYRIINKYNIPVIAVINLNQDDNKDTDFATITPDEFKSKNKEIFPLIQLSDRFIIFYKKSSKEYMVRELINDFTGTPQWFSKPPVFDIRDLLN